MALAAVCPVCTGAVVRRKPWLGRCAACGFLTSDLAAGAGTGIEGIEPLRRANFERVLDRMARHGRLEGSRILEVGCAKGWFLEAAAKRGARPSGIEPEAPNARLARRSGFDVVEGFFPEHARDRDPYDAIVFNDVFEHLPDPIRGIWAAARLLKPGGIAVINLPSSRGVIYRLAAMLDAIGLHEPFERLWQKGLPSPHVSYFAPDTLERLVLGHSGLRPLDRMELPSISRAGLGARVRSTMSGPAAVAAVASGWILASFAAILPADIMVGFFRMPGADRRPGNGAR